jgi:hypothetical protein
MYSIAGLVRPLEVEEVETPRISRQSAGEGGEVCQPYAPAAFTSLEIFLVLISVRD